MGGRHLVFYYTDETCTQGETFGEEVGHCQQRADPFLSVKVLC